MGLFTNLFNKPRSFHEEMIIISSEINKLESDEYKYGLSKSKMDRLTKLRIIKKQYDNIKATSIF